MTSSYCDIHRNLIDAPSSDSHLPASAVGSELALSGAGTADRRPTRGCSLVGLARSLSEDSLSIKYRRMKCAVVVMATLMIIASMLLVGVSLAMAEHIDELVRQMNMLESTTTTTLPTPAHTTTTTHVPSTGSQPAKTADVRES